MIGGAVKVIVAEAECDRSDYDTSFSDDCNVRTTVYESAAELLKFLIPHIVNDSSAIESLLADERFTQALDSRGVRNIQSVSDVLERIKLGTRIFVYEGWGLQEINLATLPKSDAYRIARENTVLLQAIEKDSLKEINPPLHKAVVACRKNIETSAKAREASTAARKEKALQRKLEKARKLLEESGQL